jgi:hypothetical protein
MLEAAVDVQMELLHILAVLVEQVVVVRVALITLVELQVVMACLEKMELQTRAVAVAALGTVRMAQINHQAQAALAS